METETSQPSWLDRPLSNLIPKLNVETLLIILIIGLALFTRLYHLGARVMSHDEVNHVVPAYSLYQGQGYVHDPVTHGPLQFHLMALSFFLFGDSDFTARLPHALLAVAAVAFVLFGFRRYLGRTGALVAGALFLISPYMLFYGRYARNEALIELFGVMMLFAILAYLETGQRRYLTLFTLSVVLHFTAKETAYIYVAEGLLFLAFLVLDRVTRRRWPHPEFLRSFILALIVAILLIGGGLGVEMVNRKAATGEGLNPSTVAAPATPGGALPAAGELHLLPLALIGLGLVAAAVALFFLARGLTWRELRRERSFDLLILLGTLVLPLLAPFPVKMLGWDPLDYSDLGMVRTGAFVAVMALVAIGIGLWWNRRAWLANAAIFYGIFVVLFTTIFTNGMGFFTGLVGSLGYWLSQQSVNRGSQPWYYFALIQLPMYEFLPVFGAILALVLRLRGKLIAPLQIEEAQEALPGTLDDEDVDVAEPARADLPAEADVVEEGEEVEAAPAPAPGVPVFGLLAFWSVASLVAYSVAGEKMPWLTVHIALPLILLGGWGLGTLIDRTPWARLREGRAWLVALLLPVFLTSLAAALGSLLGTDLPFAGNQIAQLQATSTFLTALIAAGLSAYGLFALMRTWGAGEARKFFGLAFFAILAVLTARSGFIASFINYDTAKEYLVYAHAARGPKDDLEQVIEISKRTTGGLDIAVAYDNQTNYPYWWYFRIFPNKVYFGDQPTRDLRNNPIILVGDQNYAKIEPIVGNLYDSFDTIRLWWPNQDYFNLTWDRLWGAVSNPELRSAIFQIWLNRDYSAYAAATGETGFTLTDWSPNNRMRMYVRKDVVTKIWNYGVGPSEGAQVAVDPYEKGTIQLNADLVVGSPGSGEGQLQVPRGLAAAPDGSIYVADSKNNRIVHLSADGAVLGQFGTFADVAAGDAPGGTFNEPWDVAVGPDGSVYVADTWNNRIQKFTPDGNFVKMWGFFGQAEKPEAFWGPRGVVVDAKGRVYVADTGNKRVVVFDSDGNFVTQFGGAGALPGQFDEPVGIALDADGNVYVADTWNQRVQVLAPDESGTGFTPLKTWDISGWYGNSLDNKPFIAVDSQKHVFVTDPEATRVLEFDDQGTFIRAWGEPGNTAGGFGLAAGVAVDEQGRVWVTDAGYQRVLRFVMPE